MATATADRCFIAVWPDDAAAIQLESLAGRLHAEYPGSRRVRRGNLHLTLAFVGPLPSALQQNVARDLAAIDVAPFDWSIDRLGIFAGARVLWASSANADWSIHALASRARSILDALQIDYDRRPFTPHVTLLRDFPRAGISQASRTLEQPIRWMVRRVVLLRSISTADGVHYVERHLVT